MRKLVLFGALALAAAATATAAFASGQATTFAFKQSSRAESSSTGVAFKVEFGDPAVANGLPSGLKSFKISMHKGTRIDPAGATQCKTTPELLMSKGAAACPAASRIGKGKATATNGTAVVSVDGFIYNEKASGKNAFLFLFLLNNAYAAAFDAPVKGNTISASGLTGAIPGGLIVTKFSGTIEKRSKGRGKKKHNLITTPAVCPKAKKWTNKATFTFVNGDTDPASATSACKP
jgi:hypothetical protein